jgi:hypothetical protein
VLREVPVALLTDGGLPVNPLYGPERASIGDVGARASIYTAR